MPITTSRINNFFVRKFFLILLLAFCAVALTSCVSDQKKNKPKIFLKKVEELKAQYVRGHNVTPVTPLDTKIDDVPQKDISYPEIGASESPRNDGIHDNINDAITILQDPAKAMFDFPRDRRNQVDWVQALEQGLIDPRANLEGDLEMLTMDLDIVMKNTQFMPWVRFPHLPHTKWLHCSNCHPAIFIPQEGANAISMNKVLRGKFCGVCHDKVAFAIFICERCHSVPHEGSGPKWW